MWQPRSSLLFNAAELEHFNPLICRHIPNCLEDILSLDLDTERAVIPRPVLGQSQSLKKDREATMRRGCVHYRLYIDVSNLSQLPNPLSKVLIQCDGKFSHFVLSFQYSRRFIRWSQTRLVERQRPKLYQLCQTSAIT